MTTSTSPHRITFILTILVSLAFFVVGADSVTAQIAGLSCSRPNLNNPVRRCVLTGTLSLKNTLTLPSNTTLDCHSHRLVPQRRGTDLTMRSIPEVAIFLNGAKNVQIKNCVIQGFDFGIFAINSKRSVVSATPQIKILQNKINARFGALSLISVDDSEISGNQLSWTTTGGRGLYVGRDSDRNRIFKKNQIGARLSTTGNNDAVRVPGPVTSSNPVIGPSNPNPLAREGSAVLIAQIEGPEPALLNAVIEGRIFQLTVTDSPQPNGLFTEENIFTGNAIRIVGTPVDGIVLSSPTRTRVSNNSVGGAKAAIRVGIQSGPPPDGFKKQFPGTCSNSTRLCLADNDCNISRFDPPDSVGTCDGLPNQMKSIFWVSLQNIIENNVISGPTAVGIATAGEGTVITGNTVTGNPGNSAIGIRLVGKSGLGTTTVTRNTVRDLSIGLNLIRSAPAAPPASEFKANIGLNDFTGYTTAAVQTSNDYLQVGATELSAIIRTLVGPRGNYWDTPCGIGLAPATVQPPNTQIQDNHHYGAPIANTPARLPCP